MKEYFSQKWLVGEDGETPILSSTESTELCPSDESTFSYANDTQVYSNFFHVLHWTLLHYY